MSEQVTPQEAPLYYLLDCTLDENERLKRQNEAYRIRAAISQANGLQTKKRNKQNQQNHKPKSSGFVKVYKTALQELARTGSMTQAETFLLFNVTTYIDFDDNMVLKKPKTPMNMTDIQELCGWERDHTGKVIDRLVKKGLLEKVKRGRNVYIRANPKYFECGYQ